MINQGMKITQTCKFRIKNMYGHCCGNPVSAFEITSGLPLCNRHKGSMYNEHQILMYNIFGNNEGLIHSDRCQKALFEYWSRGRTIENMDTSIIEMMCYMYDMQSIRYMMQNVATIQGVKKWNLKQKKAVLAAILIQEWKRIYQLVSNVAIQKLFAKMQKRWIRKLQGPYMKGEMCSNDSDPFILTAICDIPKSHIWSFREESGHVYAFNILHMIRYVEHCYKNNNDVLNPFTRILIPFEDIRRLFWLEAKTDFAHDTIK